MLCKSVPGLVRGLAGCSPRYRARKCRAAETAERAACPVPTAEIHDTFAHCLWVIDVIVSGIAISVPGFATGIDDVVVGFVEAVGELVFAQVFPNVLHGIELGRVGWDEKRGDVVRKYKPGAVIPARAVEKKDGMGTG